MNVIGECFVVYFKLMSRYKQEFGFTMPNRPIFVDDVWVRGIAKADLRDQTKLAKAEGDPKPVKVSVNVH